MDPNEMGFVQMYKNTNLKHSIVHTNPKNKCIQCHLTKVCTNVSDGATSTKGDSAERSERTAGDGQGHNGETGLDSLFFYNG